MSEQQVVRPEDVLPVGSRVSWGAVLAGSVVATAVMVLLGVFAAGIGLALTESGVRGGTAALTQVIATIFSVGVALFVGGCVAGRLTVGETRREGLINGVLVWATVSAMSLALLGLGVRTGYQVMLGAAALHRGEDNPSGRTWEDAARAAGVPEARLDEWKKQLDPDRPRNEEAQERARRVALWLTWGTLGGMLLSMLAAVWGAVVGAGEQAVLVGMLRTARGRVVVRTQPQTPVRV